MKGRDAARPLFVSRRGLFDDGEECGDDANMAKLPVSEATRHAAKETFSADGGFAFAKGYDIEHK